MVSSDVIVMIIRFIVVFFFVIICCFTMQRNEYFMRRAKEFPYTDGDFPYLTHTKFLIGSL